MSEKRQSRRSSLRAAKAISKLATQKPSSEEEDEESENASEISGSMYEESSLTSSTTDSESPDASSPENNSSFSESAEDLPAETDTKPKKTVPSRFIDATVGATYNYGDAESKVAYKRLCPFSRFLKYGQGPQHESVKKTALKYFSEYIKKLKSVCFKATHPFAFTDSFTSKEEYNKRQAVLFPPVMYWKPYSFTDKSGCLPEPPFSPALARHNFVNGTITSVVRLRRFEYDDEQRLLYVGGFIKTIAWCPPRLESTNLGTVDVNDPVYLAVASYPTPGTRVLYSDPVRSAPGLIQIWNCGPLSLCCSPQGLHPEPHLFIAHSWGLVMHMCWLPVSVTLAARPPTFLTASTSVQRALGHLIVACQDGFVRVVAIPRFALDSIFYRTSRKFPMYELDPRGVFRLSPSGPTECPDWIGWPTQLHIRSEYPNRLFVAYSKGHVALYDLSCLNSFLFDASACHLSPVRLFRLMNGPIRSMSLNPTNGRYLLIQGWDTNMRIWDFEDTASCTVESPEFQWTINHGIPGGTVIWHSRGAAIFGSREVYASTRFLQENLADFITRPDNMVLQTYFDAPKDNTRHLVPLGIQCVTHMDFSDPLNSLVCATDQGRVELVVCSLDGRTRKAHKVKSLNQLRVPLCQWTLTETQAEEKRDQKLESDRVAPCVDHRSVRHDGGSLSHSAAAAAAKIFPNPRCPDCISCRSFCWHKLWGCYTLKLTSEPRKLGKPRADLIKSPCFSVTQVEFCPSPAAATWLAMGTSFGFIQFHCADFLYLAEFDKLLNRTPSRPSAAYLNTLNAASSKSFNMPPSKLIRQTKDSQKRSPNSDASAGSSTNESRTDSDATEPMTGPGEVDTSNPAQSSLRVENGQSTMTAKVKSNATDPGLASAVTRTPVQL